MSEGLLRRVSILEVHTPQGKRRGGGSHRPAGAHKMAATAAARIVGNAALGARIEIRNTLNVPLYIDWLAAQLCGFCMRPSERPPCLTSHQSERNDGTSTAVADEASSIGASQHCVLASPPTMVGYALALHPGEIRSFLVICEALPPCLPPSFTGEAVCCEYVLFVTLRTMAPPAKSSGWLSRLISSDSDTGDANSSEGVHELLASSGSWPRAPLCRLRLPLHMDASRSWLSAKADHLAHPGAPAWCELHSIACSGPDDSAEAVLATDETGEADRFDERSEDGAHGKQDEEETDEGDEKVCDKGEGVGNDASDAPGVDVLRRSFQLRLAHSAPFATCELATSSFRIGGAVRGVLLLAPQAMTCPISRVRLSLVLEEHLLSDAQRSDVLTSEPFASNTVAKLDIGRSPPTQHISFELQVPSHQPPASTLHTNDGTTIDLCWALLFTFEMAPATGGAVTVELSPAANNVPWRLPIRMLPSEEQQPAALTRTYAIQQSHALSNLSAGDVAISWGLAAPAFAPVAFDEISLSA